MIYSKYLRIAFNRIISNLQHPRATMNRRSEKRSPFNPASNYEEKVEVEGLTLWELNRPIWKTFPVPAEATDTIQKQKQASAEDLHTISINSRVLSEFKVRHSDLLTLFILFFYLTRICFLFFSLSLSLSFLKIFFFTTHTKKCPVCMCVLRETWTVMECMHRFCSECIQRCLRGGKQECPSCRQHVPSRRSLRRDHQFDALIRTIYPNLDRHERLEETQMRVFNKVKGSETSQTLQQRIIEQNENRKRMRFIKSAPTAPKPRMQKENNGVLTSDSEEENLKEKNEEKEKSRKRKGGKQERKQERRQKRRKQEQEKDVRSKEKTHKKKSRSRRPSRRSVDKSPPSPEKDARFELRPDPNSPGTPPLRYPWLNTSSRIQIAHIRKYLARKLAAQKSNVDFRSENFSIWMQIRSTKIVLTSQSKFSDIAAIYPDGITVCLFYTLNHHESNSL